MSFHIPDPIRRIGTFSEAEKERITVAANDRWARADGRYRIAKYAAALRAEHQSWRAVARLIHVGVRTGALPAHKSYSYEGIRELVAMWDAGKRDIADYFDKPRSGGPKVTDPQLVDMIRLASRVDKYGALRRLEEQVAKRAAELGVPAPTYDTIRRLVATEGRLTASGAAHGNKAAQIDALPHSTVPARWAHDIWVLDEYDAPFYCRVFDEDIAEWVSVRPSVVTIIDQCTGVCVGHWVADPSRRRGDDGRMMRAGFDRFDVVAALMSAAFREFATSATAKFSGFLPRGIRWDNHKTHQSVRPILTMLGELLDLDVSSYYPSAQDTPDAPFEQWEERLPGGEVDGDPFIVRRNGIRVWRLPFYRAINRGKVERHIAFAKLLCRDLPTHVDRVVPLDRLTDDLKKLRDISVGAGGRDMRRMAIDPRRLPTIAEARSLLDGRMYYYNFEHKPKRTRISRAVAYARDFDVKQSRSGLHLLGALEQKTTFVTGNGIEHHHDGGSTLFAYAVPKKFRIEADATVTYRVDPLMRKICALFEGKEYWLPRKVEWADEPGRAQEVARAAADDGRYAAAEGIAAREADFDNDFGAGAAAQDRQRADLTLKLQAEQARTGGPQDKTLSPKERAAKVADTEAKRTPRAPKKPEPTHVGTAPVHTPTLPDAALMGTTQIVPPPTTYRFRSRTDHLRLLEDND